MTDSFYETKSELYELMQRMRNGRITPPTPEGVTPSEARTMMVIGGLGTGDGDVRPGRVAELMHTTPSALSQTLKTLEERGYIERRRTSGDFRAITLSLTQAGERLSSETRELCDAHLEQVMAFVGEEDMQQFVRIVRKMVQFYDEQDAGEGALHSPASCGEGDAACV